MKQISANSRMASQSLPICLGNAFALALLFIAAFSALGFLTTFESNPWWVAWPWRVAYAAFGLASLSGTSTLLRIRLRRIPASEALATDES